MLSIRELFRNTEGFFYEMIWHCETKNSSTRLLGTVKQETLNRNTWYPFIFINVIGTGTFLKHRRVLLRNDSALWDKKHRQDREVQKKFEIKKSMKHQRVPLLYKKLSALWDKKHRQDCEVQKNFRNQKVYETPKDSSTLPENFGTVSQKQSKENHDKRPRPPIFSRKIIATRNFLKHWKVPPANVLAQWDKKHRQDREVQKKFQNQKVSETPKGSSTLRESFGTGSQKQSKGNHDKRPHPPIFPEKLLLPEVLWKTGNFLHQMLRHRETKNIDRTVKCKKKFKTNKSLKHQRVPLLYSKNSALWVKKDRQDCEVQKNFRNQKVYETPTDSSTLLESFGTVSQKQSKENHDKRPHPPIFSRKIIATRNFLKHWKVPPANVLALWDKKHRQDREVQKKIQSQKVSETPKGSSTLRESFGTVRQKTSTGPWSAKKNSKPTSLWNTKGFFYSTRKIRHCESKNIDRTVKCKKIFETKKSMKHQRIPLLY